MLTRDIPSESPAIGDFSGMHATVFKNTSFSVAVCLGVLALILAGCGRSRVDTPNIILIVMDTARADHMSCYGYERPVTPCIDEFAEGATIYTRAMASGSWSVPSHASLFTGKDPFEHGAHTVEGDGRERFDNLNALSENHLTIAEALAGAGYETGAVMANNAYLNPRFHLDQGFQTYLTDGVYSPLLNQHIFDWLDSLTTQPFFLFINYFDTHTIYNMTARPGFLQKPARKDRGRLYIKLRDWILSLKKYPDGLRQNVIDQYDTAFANLDEQIGVLIEELKRRGLYEKSMIVITADHGEAFGRHKGVATHGTDVYQEIVWIPLIIKAPGQSKHRRDDRVVSLSDIPQIIFSEMSDEVVRDFREEFPNVPGEHLVISESYYARPKHRYHPIWGERFNRVRTAVYDWPYKYIYSTDGKNELYQLEGDPLEQNNLIQELPEVAETLSARLVEYQKSRPHGDELIDPGTPSEEELKRLKSLGYIGD
jgi:arylsulfatase A-like enzyme